MAKLIENKKAKFDYEFLKEYEAGIELFGFEVKSLMKKQGALNGAYIIIRGDEAFIVNMGIPPYQTENTPKNYNPERNRKLLLHKKEITELIGKEKEKGLTIIPVSLYNKNRKIKIKIAVVRSKKKHDKREVIKKRDIERDIGRTLKR